MEKLFGILLPVRGWPILARYAATTLLVAIAALLAIVSAFDEYLFIFFIPAIVIAAILFDRGNGIYAVFLSTLVAIYVFITPAFSVGVAERDDLVATVVFIAAGLLTVVLIESLHTAFNDLHLANSELRRTHREFDDALRMRDVLLAEISHRIKNDMATLSTILTMQARDTQGEEARIALMTAADRLKVLARVHGKLRPVAGDAEIDVRDFVEELCDDLRRSLVALRPISIQVQAESHPLPLSRAVPIGIIVNELVTNALKHAFPSDREGLLQIVFERTGDDFQLRVRDDGVGLPERGPPEGLGTRLVRALTAQLGGRLQVENRAPGTEYRLVFPASAPDR